jgi:hypothetical protein
MPLYSSATLRPTRLVVDQKPRDRQAGVPLLVQVSRVELPGSYYEETSPGVYAKKEVLATRAGQLAVFHDRLTVGRLYVSVQVGSTFVWKRALCKNQIIDPNTGKLWDPNAKFHNPLGA